MNFYYQRENVDLYNEMARNYASDFLVKRVREYFPDHSTLLELGMGPGTDLLALSKGGVKWFLTAMFVLVSLDVVGVNVGALIATFAIGAAALAFARAGFLPAPAQTCYYGTTKNDSRRRPPPG